jgi:hypothetical protein
MVMGLMMMQPDSVGHLPKIHGRLPRRIALRNSTGLSDSQKKCPPGHVKSRVANSGYSALGDRRDIGYTLLGGAHATMAVAIAGGGAALAPRKSDPGP